MEVDVLEQRKWSMEGRTKRFQKLGIFLRQFSPHSGLLGPALWNYSWVQANRWGRISTIDIRGSEIEPQLSNVES